MTSAHGKKGRLVMAFQGYSSAAEEKMFEQLIKMLKEHYHKHPHKLSPTFQSLAYNGGTSS